MFALAAFVIALIPAVACVWEDLGAIEVPEYEGLL